MISYKSGHPSKIRINFEGQAGEVTHMFHLRSKSPERSEGRVTIGLQPFVTRGCRLCRPHRDAQIDFSHLAADVLPPLMPFNSTFGATSILSK